MTFDHRTTADEVLQGMDLSDKRALVTGATSGLGTETARALAARGAAVTLPARDLEKAESMAEELRSATGNANIQAGEMDLGRPDSVRAFAHSWLQSNDRLDMLINNAAVMATPFTRTREGWELQFATNHLGHFLLTSLLLPALKAGAPARVVSVSSGGHRLGMETAPLGSFDFNDVHFAERQYHPWQAYAQSKVANVWFAVELNKRYAESGIEAFSLDPGGIPTTGLGRYMPKEQLQALIEAAKERRENFKSVPQGAATSVWAATATALTGKGGVFLEDCQIAGPATSQVSGYAPYAYDQDSAARLWEISEQMLEESK